MKNELGRKITSLTIMTIMVAGGLTFAAPSMTPEAFAADDMLYVSCALEDFGNTFAGGQICEVIVRDPSIAETDQVEPEPTVEVNDNTLRMVQGADGYWYAYFGSTAGVASAHANTNIDYGILALTGHDGTACPTIGLSIANSVGLSVKTVDASGYGKDQIACSGTVYVNNSTSGSNTNKMIVDAAPLLSDYGTNTTLDRPTHLGQHNVTLSEWPFIQTWEFKDDSSVTVIYEKPGADESVSLTFETAGTGMQDYAKVELDRSSAAQGSEVHVTVYDNQLNLDPTSADSVVFLTNSSYGVSYNASLAYAAMTSSEFGDNGALKITRNANSADVAVIVSANTSDQTFHGSTETATSCTGGDASSFVTIITDAATSSGCQEHHLKFFETGPNTGIFTATDDSDASILEVKSGAWLGTTATFDYNDSAQSFTVVNEGAVIDIVEGDAGDEWNSGEEVTVSLTDGDRNLNTASSEDLTVSTSMRVPTLKTGSPLQIVEFHNAYNVTFTDCDETSGICTFTTDPAAGGITWIPGADDTPTVGTDTGPIWTTTFGNPVGSNNDGTNGGAAGTATLNGMNVSAAQRYVSYDVTDLCQADTVGIAGATSQAVKAVVSYGVATWTAATSDMECIYSGGSHGSGQVNSTGTVSVNFMAFGVDDSHGVYHIEVEETDDNTGVFEGSLEYIMVNQLIVDDDNSGSITGTGSGPIMLLGQDRTGTDAPRVKYNDTDGDGVYTPVADQLDAATHSGTLDLDSDSYKVADTVTVTITDQDLNTDSGLIDVYVTQSSTDTVGDGSDSGNASYPHIMDIYFGDEIWDDDCGSTLSTAGLHDTGFALTETDVASGVFTGTFQIPAEYCSSSSAKSSTTGQDIFANYWDYKDAGGNTLEVGDSSTVRATSGSVSLDRSVYPVPFTWKEFMLHDDTYVSGNSGNVTLTVAVTDADYDQSPSGEDTISDNSVTVKVIRGATSVILAQNFELTETEASSGVFEYTFDINATNNGALGTYGTDAQLRQGDVITASYVDPTDASGNSYTNVDSSTLDLRTGSILTDKSVYVIGSDAIITIVDEDLNRDAGTIESYSLGLVEWDSDAGTVNLNEADTSFDAEPSQFRETGSDTGIFQVVIEIPQQVGLTAASLTSLDQGEKIDLEYVDYSPSGEDNYGDSTEDIGTSIYTSNFGATIELDSKVYTWTDRVFVTIVAPDHNTDTSLIDTIGGSGGSLTAQTRDSQLTAYRLDETGVDTGIFAGEITLIGMQHDADGSGGTAEGPFGTQSKTAAGPTDGLLKASESDGITVSFEYTEDSTVVSSSLIRWNIGEASFGEDAYLSSSSAVLTVTDPDMNTNPDSTENFKVDVYSDSDSGGIELTVTETNESTGIFEGTVFFTTSDASSGHTLRVSEGDSITADYSDHTLPDPYSTSDDIDVSATAVIGTQTPPLERAPVANARVVDAFGNSLAEVSVDQQVQIEADLVNGQDGDQSFAYLVQVQDSDGVTVSLAWITGQLAAGQSFSPALSWIPDASGSYEATVFVWESVDNPTALSDTASVSITVV